MTMTNQTAGARDITGQPVRSKELEAFAGLEARPLSMPDFSAIRHKNPGLECRWVEKEQKGGLRFHQMRYAGFRAVQPDEAVVYMEGQELPVPETLVKDGLIVWGDVVLMCLPKEQYFGALLHNHNTAARRTDRNLVMGEAKRSVKAALSTDYVPAPLAKKISTFVPENVESMGESNLAASE